MKEVVFFKEKRNMFRESTSYKVKVSLHGVQIKELYLFFLKKERRRQRVPHTVAP
jgi:hypothetical protein